MKKKDKAFGFFVNFDKEEIYFSRTFMDGAKVMGSGEFQMYMELQNEFPTFKKIIRENC